jgi:hypothetical protein
MTDMTVLSMHLKEEDVNNMSDIITKKYIEALRNVINSVGIDHYYGVADHKLAEEIIKYLDATKIIYPEWKYYYVDELPPIKGENKE